MSILSFMSQWTLDLQQHLQYFAPKIFYVNLHLNWKSRHNLRPMNQPRSWDQLMFVGLAFDLYSIICKIIMKTSITEQILVKISSLYLESTKGMAYGLQTDPVQAQGLLEEGSHFVQCFAHLKNIWSIQSVFRNKSKIYWFEVRLLSPLSLLVRTNKGFLILVDCTWLSLLRSPPLIYELMDCFPLLICRNK